MFADPYSVSVILPYFRSDPKFESLPLMPDHTSQDVSGQW